MSSDAKKGGQCLYCNIKKIAGRLLFITPPPLTVVDKKLLARIENDYYQEYRERTVVIDLINATVDPALFASLDHNKVKFINHHHENIPAQFQL